eukprot:3123625-Alexandrium_andersonii.AAC.1
MLVHAVWLLAARRSIGLWIERVASDDNIADLPSRESYDALEALRAAWVPPRLPRELEDPRAWAR